MKNLLYYPYINLPKTDWAVRALLYYDNVASIVPYQYACEPELFEPFMREVVQQELIRLVDPMDVCYISWEVYKQFLEYLNRTRQKRLIHSMSTKIHAGKFDYYIFNELTKLGLAKKIDDLWFEVENRTANELMTFLASVVGNAIDYIPTTDHIEKTIFSASYINNNDFELRIRQCKRDLLLKNLIPYPQQVELANLRRFKDKYHDLLEAFTNRVELVTLDPLITPESPLFQQTLEDMKADKEELVARMNESRLGDIVFGAICGTISAGIAFLDKPVLGAVPGLLNAIYSACKIQRPESVIDQTGLKYLALVDKRLRRR